MPLPISNKGVGLVEPALEVGVKLFHIPQEHRPIEQMYLVKSILGHGAFGTVFKVQKRFGKALTMIDPTVLALKQIVLVQKGQQNKSLVKLAESEIQTLIRLHCKESQHCALIKIYRYFYTSQNNSIPEVIWIEMEFISGGESTNYRKDPTFKNDPNLLLTALAHMSYDLFYTLARVHQQDTLHLDQKPANILYDNIHHKLKLADFGMSCYREACRYNYKGTYQYQDPRVLMKNSSVVPDIWSDIYSLGISLYELLTGQLFYVTSVREMTPIDFQTNYNTRRAYLISIYQPWMIKTNVPNKVPAVGALSPESLISTVPVETIFLYSIINMCEPLDQNIRPSLYSILDSYYSQKMILVHDINEPNVY